MSSEFARIWYSCRSQPHKLGPSTGRRCRVPGLQGAACRRLCEAGAPPLCHGLRGGLTDEARSREQLSRAVSARREVARRWLTLTELLDIDLLRNALIEEPALGGEMLHLAVLGTPADGVDPWREQAAKARSMALRALTVAAIATHAVWTPERRACALRVLERLPPSDGLERAREALRLAPSREEARWRRMLDPDPAERAAAIAAWSASLPGRPLRPSWCRWLASRLHLSLSGERLLERLQALDSNRALRQLLQEMGRCKRSGPRPFVERHQDPSLREAGLEVWYDPYEDWDGEWDNYWNAESVPDSWPLPAPTPAQQAALEFVEKGAGWPGQLGQRLDATQRERLRLALGERVRLKDSLSVRLQLGIDAEELLALVLDTLTREVPEDELLTLAEALRRLREDERTRSRVEAIWPSLPERVRPVALAAFCGGRVKHEGLSWACRSPLALRLAEPSSRRPVLIPTRWGGDGRALLRTGAGTLARMDYPSFELTVRASVSTVRPEHGQELESLCAALDAVRAALSQEAGPLLEGLAAVASEAVPGEAAAALHRHVVAHVLLRRDILRDPDVRLRSSHIRRFWERISEQQPPPETWAALRERWGQQDLTLAIAHALLQWSREPPRLAPGAPRSGDKQRPVERRIWTHLLRLLSLVYDLPEAPRVRLTPEAQARERVDHLLRALDHAPLELCQALGLDHRQGLPRLQGGARSPLEQRIRQTLRSAFHIEVDQEAEALTYTCRPLSKEEALGRGDLGRDCSSRSVPLRALSPHHVYYGLVQGGQPRPGYLTVFEAFAVDAQGQRSPVLVLETINVPDGALDTVQQDLMRLFEAIAFSRGLSGLVVVMGIGTWNFQNQEAVRHSRRHRQGEEVRLQPADPCLWQAYEELSGEGRMYCAFRAYETFRRLAPFDATHDRIQPENEARAQALLQLPPRPLEVLALDATGATVAFISSWPV